MESTRNTSRWTDIDTTTTTGPVTLWLNLYFSRQSYSSLSLDPSVHRWCPARCSNGGRAKGNLSFQITFIQHVSLSLFMCHVNELFMIIIYFSHKMLAPTNTQLLHLTYLNPIDSQQQSHSLLKFVKASHQHRTGISTTIFIALNCVAWQTNIRTKEFGTESFWKFSYSLTTIPQSGWLALCGHSSRQFAHCMVVHYIAN